MNATISINNSTVVVYECDNRAKNARDELLEKLFHARHKATMGGVSKMIENISSFSGPGGATRKACIQLIKTIAKSEEVN